MMFPSRRSNQITYKYYAFLIGQIDKGLTRKKVFRVQRKNGSQKYSTYHLVSTM